MGRAPLFFLLLFLTTSCTSTRALVVLLPDESGRHGAAAIGQGDAAITLDAPMTAARIDNRGRVEKGTITQAEVEKNFAEVLAALPPKPISFTLYFEEGSTNVLNESRETLSQLFSEVAKREAAEVDVIGHTDTLGKESDNDRLSMERAEAVKKMLVAQGLKASSIRAIGRGSRDLLVPTPDQVREPRNRRVEVIVR